jgi:AbrB family looped-hinge helix DNA binding protein
MQVRIDKAGRVVVPKPVRERMGFKPDTGLEAVEKPEGVLLKRAQERSALAKVDGVWVHQGRPEAGAGWARVVDDVRNERIASLLED